MIKKWQDFIFENSQKTSLLGDTLKRFLEIYNNEIVPNLGDLTEISKNIYNTEDLLIDVSRTLTPASKFKEFTDLISIFEKNRNEFANFVGDEISGGRSFSGMASSGRRDPDEDFADMMQSFKNDGWNLTDVGILFNPVVSLFLGSNFAKFIDVKNLDNMDGEVDFFLYKLNEKLDLQTKVWLGGYAQMDALHDEEEYVIKYSYGYHKTPYGKLYIKQMGLTSEEFVENALVYMKEHIISNFDTRGSFSKFLYNGIKQSGKNVSFSEFIEIYSKINFKDYIITDDDRIIVSYSDFWKDFIELLGGYADISEDNLSITIDDLKGFILRNIGLQNLDVQDTGDEFIFS